MNRVAIVGFTRAKSSRIVVATSNRWHGNNVPTLGNSPLRDIRVQSRANNIIRMKKVVEDDQRFRGLGTHGVNPERTFESSEGAEDFRNC